ncbi:MAG: TrmJ/YjtD family RNA methyltransferase [Spirochaetales bacterium]|nr:TrmJ/YjtD family RNA methyltransferase [Spirochaetales bacterium]
MKTDKLTLLTRFRIVLVHPKNPRNIGSVCRAMKTMGITNLAIVTSEPFDETDAAVSAVHAEELLSTALRVNTLEKALTDTVYSAGITRRRGKFRKYYSLLPEEFAKKAFTFKNGIIALVFGTEEGGLTDEELACCHTAVHIPSSPLFPSLNLLHAVQVLCYTLFRHAYQKHIHEYTPVMQKDLDVMIQHIIDYLAPLDFYKNHEPERLSRLLNDVFGRSQLSKGESSRILSLFRKINGVFHKKTSGRKKPGNEKY